MLIVEFGTQFRTFSVGETKGTLLGSATTDLQTDMDRYKNNLYSNI